MCGLYRLQALAGPLVPLELPLVRVCTAKQLTGQPLIQHVFRRLLVLLILFLLKCEKLMRDICQLPETAQIINSRGSGQLEGRLFTRGEKVGEGLIRGCPIMVSRVTHRVLR